MKNIFFILLFSFLATSSFAQEYASHTVQKGETVFGIAKQYGISESLIYQLNPDIKNGIKTGDFLIVPEQGAVILTDLKKHRVKRRETIKSIALKYHISEDDLKKYNKELYSRQVKKGEKIDIPIFKKVQPKTSEETPILTEKVSKHIVLPKETKYGLARKYGISILELEKMNPTMGDSLQIGEELMVPLEVVSEDNTVIENENYEYYEVLPKEGFFRLKIKLGLTEEEIIALNPYAKEGLKEGMVLKIPKKEGVLLSENTAITNLEKFASNTGKKHLAIMLPFKLNRVETDSINKNKELLKKDGTLRIALDFYSGVLMATEFAKDLGISIQLDVYDTEASASKVNAIISNNDFQNVDAVIGPLMSKNMESAASKLQAKQIPIISPLSKRNVKQFSNFYQSIPSQERMGKAMLDYIVAHSDSLNIVVITGSKWTKSKGVIMDALPNAKTIVPEKDNYFSVAAIREKMDMVKENWVILDSNDPILVSNVIGLLNGLPEIVYEENEDENKDEEAEKVEIGRYNVRLFAVTKSDAFNYSDVSNEHLAHLKFTFPSANKQYDYEDLEPFLVSYKNKYGVYPNRFAVRGFDVTYDVILRLASSGNLTNLNGSVIQTEYIENKFLYKNNTNSGYINDAFYIMKYNDELRLEEVE